MSTGWPVLLRLSEQMLDAARLADWAHLAEIEQQRNPVLHSYFTSDSNPVTAIEQGKRIRQLQAIEDEVLAACKASRKNTVRELQSIERGKKVGKAYLTVSA
jgi:hypothetical protein